MSCFPFFLSFCTLLTPAAKQAVKANLGTILASGVINDYSQKIHEYVVMPTG